MKTEKFCPGCKEVKALGEFYKNRRKSDGVSSYCKECDKQQTRNWQAENLERSRQRTRAWQAQNPERYKQKVIQWRLSHPDRIRVYDWNSYARKAGKAGKITLQQWIDLNSRYGNQCVRCHRTDVLLTPDHVVPLSRGGEHNIENIQPLCASCNSIKNDSCTDYRPK